MAVRTSTFLLLILGLALVILGLGGLGIWFQGSTTVPAPDASSGPPVPSPLPSTPSASPRPDTSTTMPRGDSAAQELARPSLAPALPPAATIPADPAIDFQTQLDELFEAGLDDMQISQRLLSMMPRLAASNQVEAVEVLIDLLPDEYYGSLVPILTNALSNPEVLDVLMGDLLSRPDATQLPLLWEIARTPEHPRRLEAKDYLELFLEEDYGTDWGQWARAIADYLNQPEAELIR